MKCDRCGWEWDPNAPLEKPKATKLLRGYPPLPPMAHPHPVDRCPSPFALGDTIWWETHPDLPPLRGIFLGLLGFFGPELQFRNGHWVEAGPRQPSEVCLTVVPESVLEDHLPYLGKDYLLREGVEYGARVADCHAYERWPVLVAD